MATRLGILSPHLDDAVLSCAHVLVAHRDSVVVTVFSGGPPSVDPLPPWDESSGCFRPGDDVVGARRREDEAALGFLHASSVQLDFWDNQYRTDTYGAPTRVELLAEIEAALDHALGQHPVDAWLIPLGILHPDHQATSRAALAVALRRPDLRWIVYEELPYHVAYPDERARALDRLRDAGFDVVLTSLGAGAVDKARAIRFYASQVPSLEAGFDQAVAGPEVFHDLVVHDR